jgi:PcfJ-like protein
VITRSYSHHRTILHSFSVVAQPASVAVFSNDHSFMPQESAYQRATVEVIANICNGETKSITLHCSEPSSNYGRSAIYDDRVEQIAIKWITFHKRGGISYSGVKTSVKSHQTFNRPEYFIRRYRNHDDFCHIFRLLNGWSGSLVPILDRSNCPLELKRIRERNSQLSIVQTLCYFACPFTQFSVQKDCFVTALAMEPGLYISPSVRKACRRGDFRAFMQAWIGNTTKPVMRMAIQHGIMTRTHETADDIGYYLQDGKLNLRDAFEGTVKGPIVYSKYIFEFLKNKGFALEHTASITAMMGSIHYCQAAVPVAKGYSTDHTCPEFWLNAIEDMIDLLGIERTKHFLLTGKERDYKDLHAYSRDCVGMMKQYGDPSKFTKKKSLELFPKGLTIKRSWKTFKELHDDMSRRFTKINAIESRKRLEFTEMAKKMHGMRAGDLRILVPRTTTKLTQWGKDQDHCIANYGQRMEKHECILFGVYRGKQLLYCGRVSDNPPLSNIDLARIKLTKEVSFHKLQEIRSKGNKKVPPDDLRLVFDMLIELNVEALYADRL